MKGISAVIISKNESENIRRCLESLREVADECLLIDTFSDDGTTKIAASMGTKVIQREWDGYSEAKNFGNSQASFDYILSLDADEALSPELKKSILNEKTTLAGAYSFNRRNNYCGKWIRFAGWYPDRKIRLFPKNSAKWEGEFVHEKLVPTPGLTLKKLNGDLLHYAYETVGGHIEKTEKYARLGGREISKKSSLTLLLNLMIKPVVKFINVYFIRFGLLEGWRGFTIAGISAWGTLLKYRNAIKVKTGRVTHP